MDIDLSKPFEIVLEKRKLKNVVSRVGLGIDISSSMTSLFKNGEVDALVKRTFTVADRFDDNHELDAIAFNSDYNVIPGITSENLSGYVPWLSRQVGGGTAYAPVISKFVKEWFPVSFLGLIKKKPLPAFLILQTDGDNIHDTAGAVENALSHAASNPMFVFFLGLGSTSFPKFEAWANKFNNVDYLVASQLEGMSPDDFYEKLISQKLADFYHKHGVAVQ